jgi:hypothetical protein
MFSVVQFLNLGEFQRLKVNADALVVADFLLTYAKNHEKILKDDYSATCGE